MKQIHGLNMLKEHNENKINLGKKTYQEQIEDLCTEYLMPLLKKHITDETNTPLLIKALKTIDDRGYVDRNNLTDEENDLIFSLYLKCLIYTENNKHLFDSNLKEETKIDIIINDFLNSDIEKELKTSLEDE